MQGWCSTKRTGVTLTFMSFVFIFVASVCSWYGVAESTSVPTGLLCNIAGYSNWDCESCVPPTVCLENLRERRVFLRLSHACRPMLCDARLAASTKRLVRTAARAISTRTFSSLCRTVRAAALPSDRVGRTGRPALRADARASSEESTADPLPLCCIAGVANHRHCCFAPPPPSLSPRLATAVWWDGLQSCDDTMYSLLQQLPADKRDNSEVVVMDKWIQCQAHKVRAWRSSFPPRS